MVVWICVFFIEIYCVLKNVYIAVINQGNGVHYICTVFFANVTKHVSAHVFGDLVALLY